MPSRLFARFGRVRRFVARRPLRVKLVATLLLLVLVTLTGSGVVGVATMQAYLTGRVDSQLRATAEHPGNDVPIAGSTGTTGGTGQPDGGSGGASDDRHRLPSAFVIEVTDSAGKVMYGPVSSLIDPREPLPRLPALTAAESKSLGSRTFSIDAVSGDGQWQVLVEPVTLSNQSSGTLLVAQSLGDVQGTVDRLAALLAVIGAAAVILVAALGYLVVRASLRPLARVELTAVAIAGGDLTRRVPEAEPGTEVGQLSAALNTMLAEIERAFLERSASESAARRSEQQMRRFVADASHELRTPLTSIRGFAELYRQGAVRTETDVRRLVSRIEAEATRMGLLVDDLLMLARLDQQRPLAQAPVDLLAVAADAVTDMQLVNPGRHVRLEVGETDPPPIVTGDDARLRQILGNLLANAAQHTPSTADVVVRVETGLALDGTDVPVVLLSVADNGPGMSAEDAEHIFERFYRTDESRSRNDGGTGLGLAIVAALVAGHGGTVGVETAPGVGSIFLVQLPLLTE